MTLAHVLTVALGPRRYRVERSMFIPDTGQRVSDVAVARDGAVHVLLRGDPCTGPRHPAVVTLAADGTVLARWGAEVLDAHMIHAAGPLIHITDRDAHSILTYRDTRLIARFGRADRPGAPLNHPTALASGPAGLTVAGGYADGSVHLFGPDFAPRVRWGRLGRGAECFRNPHDIAQSAEGLIYVADRGNNAIKAFKADGALQHMFDALTQPMAVEITRDGMVLVSDATPTLSLFTPALELIGQCRPVDIGAHGIACAPDGTIWMAEPNPSRLSRLVPL